MKELIARLEAATEGSRDLDFEIWKLHAPTEFFGQKIVAISWSHGDVNIETADGFMHFDTHDVPLFTKSIDAALTLIQGGLFVLGPTGDRSKFDKRQRWLAFVDKMHNDPGEPKLDMKWCFGCWEEAYSWGVEGATPALVLCVAALKARS